MAVSDLVMTKATERFQKTTEHAQFLIPSRTTEVGLEKPLNSERRILRSFRAPFECEISLPLPTPTPPTFLL